MKITTPGLKPKINEKQWRKKIAKCLGGGFGAERYYKFKVDNETYYYPYWIGKIKTVMNRLVFPPKVIWYYVVCDAVDQSFIVLRGVPKTQELSADSESVISYSLEKDDFDVEIIKEAVEERINRQFIAGTPKVEFQGSYLLHIPTQVVSAKLTPEAMARERSGNQTYHFFVNVFTGQPKAIPKICYPKAFESRVSLL